VRGDVVGHGLLTEPQGVSLGPAGELWIADPGNDRIEHWNQSDPPPAVPVEPAPMAAVETSDGLIDSIEGEATGTITYDHEDAELTAVEGSSTTTYYGYDSEGRLNRIDLPMTRAQKSNTTMSAGSRPSRSRSKEARAKRPPSNIP
jgi:YD repeat-containing protein